LNGSYTINKNNPASSLNYRSFESAVSDLMYGSRTDGGVANGPGISSAVEFVVGKGSGPYEEQVMISAVTGTSASNTITFDGQGEWIEYQPKSTDRKFAFYFDGISYLTIRNLNIKLADLSGGRNIQIANESNYCVIEGCELVQEGNTNITYSAFISFCENDSFFVDGKKMPGSHFIIRNNTLSNNGMCPVNVGIYIGGIYQDTTHMQISIRNNKIRDFRTSAISAFHAPTLEVVGNDISHNFPIPGASFIDLSTLYQPVSVRVDSNYIHDVKYNNTYIHELIKNSSVYFSNAGEISIQHNRIVADSVSSNCYGITNLCAESDNGVKVFINHNEITLKLASLQLPYTTAGIKNTINDCSNIQSSEVIGNDIQIYGGATVFGVKQIFGNSICRGKNIIANNIVAVHDGRNITGVSLSSDAGSLNQVYYNTVAIDVSNSSSGSRTLLETIGGRFDIRNNILFGNLPSGSIYGIQTGSVNNLTVDHNSIFLDGSGNKAFVSGTSGLALDFNTFFKNFSEGNDIQVDPMFAGYSTGDLHTTNQFIQNFGEPVADITEDIYGNKRDAQTPDMGAIENATVSIAEINHNRDNNNFSVYPNPANGEIVISRSDISKVQIFILYDLEGKELARFELNIGNESEKFQLPDLASGLYLLRTISGNGSLSKKIRIM
ncbi:MAG: T9SS type A sorting domain-containing protein, partial [Bacteroidetes bacterium]|nr:T9SS type A sorting domain-containing protein [Bacteroidota bacterium]